MKLLREIVEKIKSAKSADEVLAIAKECNVEITPEEADKYFHQLHSGELGISDIQSEGCYYITFKAKDKLQLDMHIAEIIQREGLDTEALVGDGECPIYDKYDEYIPPELLRTAYARDRLDGSEIIERYGGGSVCMTF